MEKSVKDATGRKADPPRGILHPLTAPSIEHERILPGEGLSSWIRHFWWVKWKLDGDLVRENLPHPSVHLTFQDNVVEILGVTTKRFRAVLSGNGWVLGVKFEPGAFSAITGDSVSDLTDRRLPASDFFGTSIDRLGKDVFACAEMEDRITIVQDYLSQIPVRLSDDAILAGRLVRRLETEPGLLRVEDLCVSEGLSLRKAQRLFKKHVGVTPRWVISRYRIHEALDRLQSAKEIPRIDWAAFALELGYYDQAHFIKDFTSATGCSPGEYEKANH